LQDSSEHDSNISNEHCRPEKGTCKYGRSYTVKVSSLLLFPNYATVNRPYFGISVHM